MEAQRTILQMIFDSRSVGRFAHPDIQIFTLSGFEEEHVVAVV